MEIVEHSNRLINESSPYLLQHAHNPVDWYPWGDEAFRRAKAENKLVLVSIGYSSCHWCHVMEKESFEDENIASLMNANFVCIKVDREEHTDVDHVYMDAVQILTGSGGWPLNCFTLPDGRPIYGGTYFRKKDWENILLRLSNLYKSTPEQAIRQAEQLYEGISITGIPKSFVTEDVNYKDIIDKSFPKIHSGFDIIEGGFKGHPKFPLPVVWNFIFDYQIFTGDNLVADQLILTLDNMALGGLYDQLGGGFARYSTDSHWLVPHFEKMLYDNAQLVSLYSKAFQRTNNKLYKKIVDETLLFVKRELSGPDGGFYSSYDADSIEGEGAYYVWTKREIDDLLGENSGWFCNLFNISEEGNWEGKNILYLKSSEYKLLKDEDKRKITECMAVLFQEREKRTKPELDDKIITSWNCLMINAFIDAYNAFENEEYLKTAEKNVDFILNRLMSDNITLYRIYKKGNKKIPAFLDDYAFLINSLIQLYQATFEEKWIIKARELTNQVISVFMDEEDGLFFYTDEKRDLPVRKKELQDSVIPSSNSVMAENLFFLSSFFESKVYKGVYVDMIKKLQENIKSFPRYYSNWLNLCLLLQQSSVEVVITGKEAMKVRKEILPYLKPNHILAGTISESKFPLLHLRHVEDKTLIYVCTNQVCSMPVDNVKEAISLLSDNSGKVNI